MVFIQVSTKVFTPKINTSPSCQMSGTPPQTTRTSNRLWNLWKKSYNKGLASAQSVPAVIVQRVCVLPLNSSHFILANTHCKQASVYINIDTHDQLVSFFIITVLTGRTQEELSYIKSFQTFENVNFPIIDVSVWNTTCTYSVCLSLLPVLFIHL